MENLKGVSLEWAPIIPANIRPSLRGLLCSLLRTLINYGRKKVYSIGPLIIGTTTLSITTFSQMILSITTFRMSTLSITINKT